MDIWYKITMARQPGRGHGTLKILHIFLSLSVVSSFVDCSSQCFGFIGQIFNLSALDGGGGRFFLAGP